MRAFVALLIPAAGLKGSAEFVDRCRHSLPHARWVPSRNRHLTLFFLGEVSSDQRRQLVRLLRPLAARHHEIKGRLTAGGTFPPSRPARVAWIGVDLSQPFHDLQAEVTGVCEQIIGRRERRPFHPHLTVARCRRPWPRAAVERWSALCTGYRGEPFSVRRITLMESVLGRDGARYRVVEEFPFGGEDVRGELDTGAG